MGQAEREGDVIILLERVEKFGQNLSINALKETRNIMASLRREMLSMLPDDEAGRSSDEEIKYLDALEMQLRHIRSILARSTR